MSPQEWLRNASQNGSNQISDSHRSLLLRLGTYDEETLWTLLVLLSACFADLAKAGHVNSLPPNMDLPLTARTFMHLSSTMAAADALLKGHGSESSALQGYDPSIGEEGL